MARLHTLLVIRSSSRKISAWAIVENRNVVADNYNQAF